MQATAGNGPVPLAGRAMSSCKCWLSGLLYSMPRSTTMSSCARTADGISVNSIAIAIQRFRMFRFSCPAGDWVRREFPPRMGGPRTRYSAGPLVGKEHA